MGNSFRLPPLYTFLDVMLVLLISAVSAGFYGYRLHTRANTGPLEVMVQFEDRELARLPLETDTTLSVRGVLGEVKVVVAGGAVKFEDANCPARICEKTGWVNRPGGVIVCAPNHLMARVESAEGAEVEGGRGLDALSR